MPAPIDATLKKGEKNVIRDLLNFYTFEVKSFQWTERSQWEGPKGNGIYCKVSVLTHTPTGYYIVFGRNHLKWSPGKREKCNRSRTRMMAL